MDILDVLHEAIQPLLRVGQRAAIYKLTDAAGAQLSGYANEKTV